MSAPKPIIDAPFVLLEDPSGGPTLLYRAPVAVLTAASLAEVDAVLSEMCEAQRAGYHLAGFCAYEAGYAFEPRLARLAPATRGPLLCFGVFRAPEVIDVTGVSGSGHLTRPDPDWSRQDYLRRFERVIGYIRSGDVYQVNLTMPLRGRWQGDPVWLYAQLRRHQPAPFGGVVSLGDHVLVSLSPELFFETEGRRIRVRPMKGTAPRGRDPAEDDALAAALRASEKDRAENLMIVDLLRNDLSRSAEIGSVTVTDLFTVERYPTVFQMTSGIEAELRAGTDLRDVFANLFPCGSVTGAPKIRAMEIIHALEEAPRGAYCGGIGAIRPDGGARFNVAIRTATLSADGCYLFNVGSGIVFDSEAPAEYDECLLKARFLAALTQALA